jgi:TrmH family RNA methyltransferase
VTAAPTAPSLLDAVHVVLFEPQDPINIAATVRAMKNMGARSLRLVRPVAYDPNLIEIVAHDTRDVVAEIRHFDSLDAALADCVRVAAFAGKRRAAKWTLLTPRAAADDLLEHAALGPVALLFGREDHGLPREALDRAHVTVTIPTTEYSSLNMAQAALVALYELHVRAGDATRTLAPPRKDAPPATGEQFEQLFVDAERALASLDFFKTRNNANVMRSLRSLVYRAAPDSREIQLVRSMALEVLRTIERVGRAAAARATATVRGE